MSDIVKYEQVKDKVIKKTTATPQNVDNQEERRI